MFDMTDKEIIKSMQTEIEEIWTLITITIFYKLRTIDLLIEEIQRRQKEKQT